VELQDRLEELENSGIGIAAISYDSQEVLADFAGKRGITFPLLSDDGSSVITEFGILNTVVSEGLGPNRDDPDVVADIHKYVAASVFDSQRLRRQIVGTPYPGTFMLDANARVTSRFFEEFYRERTTTSNVMLKLGIGLTPIAAVRGTTAQLKFTAYPSNPMVTAGSRFSLAVEVEPNPDMHVYAPGAETMGYRERIGGEVYVGSVMRECSSDVFGSTIAAATSIPAMMASATIDPVANGASWTANATVRIKAAPPRRRAGASNHSRRSVHTPITTITKPAKKKDAKSPI